MVCVCGGGGGVGGGGAVVERIGVLVPDSSRASLMTGKAITLPYLKLAPLAHLWTYLFIFGSTGV